MGEFEDRESTSFISDPDVGCRMMPNQRNEWDINGHRFAAETMLDWVGARLN